MIKNLAGSLVIAFSMYTKFPMPRIEWTENRMKYAMCFFPLTGVAVGFVLICFWQAALKLLLPPFAVACFGTVIPLLVTGGIHMDGFLDVTDARSSYQPKEKKLEILKDPRSGAFAVMGCGVYLLLYSGFFFLLPLERIPVFAGTFLLTRAFSGLSVVCFPKAKNSGLAAAFSEKSQKTVVVLTMAGYLAVSFWYCCCVGGWNTGVACFAVSCIIFYSYYRMSMREFGGITGDLAGYFLQLCELALLAAVVFTAFIM